MANVIVPSRLVRESRVQPPSYLLPDPYPVAPLNSHDDNPLLGYWRVLRKRCWLILACVVVATVLAALSAMRAVPLYQAASRIAIGQGQGSAQHAELQRIAAVVGEGRWRQQSQPAAVARFSSARRCTASLTGRFSSG